MVLEVAFLQVVPGWEAEFEAAFAKASMIIATTHGYRSHRLDCCLEVTNKYLLLVQWDALEDHTVGFRGSDASVEWKGLLHHFYDPFPIVEHFTPVLANEPRPTE